MQNRTHIALLIFSFFILLLNEIQSSNVAIKENTKTLQAELYSILFQADTSILNTQREPILQILNQINYFDLLKYSESLEKLYQLNSAKCLKDEELSHLIVKNYALLLYRESENLSAIAEFDKYFKEFHHLKDKNDDFIFERIKYANIYKRLGNNEEFLKITRLGLKEYSESEDKLIEKSQFLLELGKYHLSENNYDSASLYFSNALDTYFSSDTKDHYILANIYRYYTNLELNNYQAVLAVDYAEKALDQLLLTNPTDYELAIYYKNKALALFFNYQISSAIDYFKMTARIYEQERPSSSSLSEVYRYIGWANFQNQDYLNALSFYEKSIQIKSDISNFITYRQLADTYFAIDSIDKASIIYNDVIKYLESRPKPNQHQIAVTKIEYGRLLVENTEDTALGEKLLSESIQTYYQIFGKNNFNLLYPLNLLGTYYVSNDQIDRGLDTLQSALKCSSRNFNPKSIYENPDYSILDNNVSSSNTLAWKARGLFNRYLKTNQLKDLEASLETYDFYIFCSSENRKYFDKSSSIISSRQIHYVYNEAINVAYLMYKKTKDSKFIDDVFRFTEGKKSFTLFQSLKILENKKLLKIPQDLLSLELKLKQELSLLSEQIIDEKKTTSSKTKIDSLENTAFSHHLQIDSIQRIFKEEYSGFYNLKYGFQDLDIYQARNKIPQKSAFINYSIADSLLHSICFTKDTVYLHTQLIDTVFFNHIEKMVSLMNKVNTDKSDTEFKEFTKSSHYLYNVLVYPLIEHIKGLDIVFIPDDELNYLSFDALIIEEVHLDRPDYRRLNYLIKQYKSNVANSMQIYFNMKQRLRNPNNEVYAFAPYYPLFANEDSLPEEYKDLRPLDYAKMEIETISKSMNTVSFIGQDATKDTFRKTAAEAGILHLAMHTIINDNEPLNSKFLFTHSSNNKSSMLNTYELLAFDLNAELAVLSGCSTGDGKLQKGEGVMSLSSGFQYAGVPAIVMSLWEVNDRFGSLVIHKFYENLANGNDKKQALYQAKVDVLNQGNALYAHPYYWAGLTLMGDDSKIDFINRYRWDLIVIVFAPILFIIIVLFQTRRKWIIKKV